MSKRGPLHLIRTLPAHMKWSTKRQRQAGSLPLTGLPRPRVQRFVINHRNRLTRHRIIQIMPQRVHDETLVDHPTRKAIRVRCRVYYGPAVGSTIEPARVPGRQGFQYGRFIGTTWRPVLAKSLRQGRRA